MTSLPIVERELRVASRNWRSYWSRSAAALIAIVVAAVPIVFTQDLMPEESGRLAFIALSTLAGLYCLCSGPATTADCLSIERREGTLGFLFLTDLRVHDIIAGKLAACSLKVAYSLAASLPVIALPLLMGGISIWEFLRVATVLTNILLFSLSTGILSSTLFKTSQNAVGWCAITLLTLAGGVPMFVMIWFDSRSLDPNFMWMTASPGFALAAAFTGNFSRLGAEFYVSNSLMVIASLVCLQASCRILPHVWQDRPGGVKRQRWRELWRNLLFGNSRARATLRRQLLDVSAFCWLASRIIYKRAVFAWTIGVLTVLWIFMAVYHEGNWLNPATYMASAIGIAYIFRLAIASESVQPLAEARSLGALELLLSTPLTGADIIRGQWLAIQRIYLAPFLVTVGLMFLMFIAGLADPEMESDRLEWMVAWACGVLVFITDLAAILYVGMWSGLTSVNLHTAMTYVLFKILMLPWLLLGVLMMSCAIVCAFGFRVSFDPPTSLVIVLWCVISLSLNAWFALRSKKRLEQRVRLVAMMRFQRGTSRLAKFLGASNSS